MVSAMVRNLNTEAPKTRRREFINDMKIPDAFCRSYIHGKYSLLSLCLCVSVVVTLACGSKPTDPRTAIAADSLVYLETSDLGKVLEAITSNPKFQELAKTKPDTSALNGVRVSIAVTGFQTTEEAASEDHAVLSFKPRFVAVAETNAWNYQALSFAENKLGEFVNDIYDGEVELVTTDKHSGKYFTWTARDGRKAFALVRGSLIFFGNDETAIDNCVNVMSGGAESIARNAKVSGLPAGSLASGYVSKEGVAQVANIAGISLALGVGEETEVKNFIARIVPEIVRNSVTEVAWAARQLEDGRIEDSYTLSLELDTAKVLSETIIPGGAPEQEFTGFIPKEFVSATRYNLKDPQIAWRSLLLTARTKTDQVSGSLLTAFSSSLFEPYGIENPELFLSGVSGSLQTVRLDAEGEEVVAIAHVKDAESVRASLAKELNLAKFPIGNGTVRAKPPSPFETIWRSEDGELAATIYQEMIVIGDAAGVDKCKTAYVATTNAAADSVVSPLRSSNAAIVTIGSEADPQARLVTVLGGRKEGNDVLIKNYVTETRFNKNGIERRTVSDFGLIGTIIERLDPGN